ncbi:unnamed protein product [Parascedosporium putredinis]|uniref:Uncharacterized protein n=1 Tax=Parascedosporium putredinis TaxID=1442378 RepID=A0A9P1H9N5_9PEZI|nr:unnamed protein product [Parascedosporium putredinis]CAI8001880.1 unnamed protein product [Parascedosporium putredinis]
MQRFSRLARLRPPPSFEAARHAASLTANPHTIRVQRRFMGITSLFLGFYLVSSVAIEVVDEDEEDYEGSFQDDREGVRGGPEETALEAFIPFPFTEQLIQPPSYHRGSPEWVAFDKINRDPNLKTKMKKDLGDLTMEVLGANKVLQGRWGQPLRSQGWLKLSFPVAPHPEWMQQGLLIRNGEIAWAVKQPVDPYVIKMLHNVLWPAPLASALWQYTKTVTGQGLSRFFGIDGTPTAPTAAGGVIIVAGPDERRSHVSLPVKRQIPGSTTTGTSSTEQGKHVPSQPGDTDQTASRSSDTRKDGGATGEDNKALGPSQSKLLDIARAPVDLLRDMSPTAWDQLVFQVRSIWARALRLSKAYT